VRAARRQGFRSGFRAGRGRIRSNIVEEDERKLQLLNQQEQSLLRAQSEADAIHAGLV
jgi:hypothetical protein